LHGGQTFDHDRKSNSLPHYIAGLNGGKRRIPMKPNLKKLTGIALRALFIGVGFITLGCSGSKAPTMKTGQPESVKVVCRCHESCEQKAERARALYDQRRYHEAIHIFYELLSDNRCTNADYYRYWIGECYVGLGNREQAVAEFKQVKSSSTKHEAALYMFGQCQFQLGRYQEARNTFTELVVNHPKGEYANKALNYLGKMNISAAYAVQCQHDNQSKGTKLVRTVQSAAPIRSCADCIANFSAK
jgi:tetratricopeptide (TPR) repeat protein